MSIIQIATPFNIDIEFEQAEFHKRLLAYIIDFIILIVYLSSMIYILFGSLELYRDEENYGFIILIIFLPMLFYTLLTELWMNGQTLGKKILRIKVVSLDGGGSYVRTIFITVVFTLLRMGIYYSYPVFWGYWKRNGGFSAGRYCFCDYNCSNKQKPAPWRSGSRYCSGKYQIKINH
ncbi:MAG: RDD family protein [Chitinophagaceae bacterium]|nr:RDD family protein [Chitinophagaceae bacterium]